MSNHKKINIILGWAIFVIATILYFLTLEPTSSFWDSGEFIATAYKMQIPHPPGAPLFMLLGRFFSLFSFGNKQMVAVAVNALSAVSSGLAVMFLCWTIILIGSKLINEKISAGYKNLVISASGVIGSLAFAFSDSYWYSATETEVYALSTLFTSFVFWAILKWETFEDESKANKWLILIAYLMGLSVGVHLLNLLAIPSLALVYYFKRYKKTTWKGVISTLLIAGGVLGAVLYGLVTTAKIAKNLEIFFVNNLSLPFNSGIIFFVLLVVSFLIYSIRYSIRKGSATLNTALLCLSFIMIGYSSYTIVLIRANYNPPVNQNDPNNVLRLISYLTMEQYPTRPLLYGPNFTAQVIDQTLGMPIYEKGERDYQVTRHKIDTKYDPKHATLLPRMYNDEHATLYQQIAGLRPGQKPGLFDNMYFMFKHQMGHMYFRYLMWNFSGRESSIDGAGSLHLANSLTSVPDIIRNDKGRNNYFMLPLLLGIVGLIFLYKKDIKAFSVVGLLFLMTGFALVVYLNGPPAEPRERDYIFVGSYYAFSIFIGVGVIGLFHFIAKLMKQQSTLAVASTLAISLAVPAIMLVENYDDHDRSQRFFSTDQAKNMLASCAPNAILFTGGDNDTYPLWYVQEVEGFRRDVRVIVMSYANVDWYINQFYRKVNDSEPLPLSLNQINYKEGGLNDQLIYVENPGIKGAINIEEYLHLIDSTHPALQVDVSIGKLNMFPSKDLIIKVDPNEIIKKKLVPQEFERLLADNMIIKVKKNYLLKRDLVLLDLIDTNNWERPVYFNNTSLNDSNLDLQRHVVQEGDTFRLLPIVNPEPESALVNTEVMYDNMMHKTLWRNLDNENIHYSGYYNLMAGNQRSNFNTLANALLEQGNTGKARQVLFESLKVLPDKSLSYDFASVQTISLLLALNETDTANTMAEVMAKRADELLKYIEEENKTFYSRQRMTELYVLNNLAAIYEAYGYKAKAEEYKRRFISHYQKLNS